MIFDAVTNEQPVIILGAGITGRSCARYCQRNRLPFLLADTRCDTSFSAELVGLFDESNIHLGRFNKTLLIHAGLIIKSPGIDAEIEVIQAAVREGVRIVSDLDIFLADQTAKIIAVTGSNGKSTVVDCLSYTLDKLGIEAVSAGNIGTPVLDLLEKNEPEVFVLELSSFQLESMKQLNAEVAAIINITEDHLDRHGTFERYCHAKHKIYQGARNLVFNQDDLNTYCQTKTDAAMVSFGKSSAAQIKVDATYDGFVVVEQEYQLIDESESRLKGIHNGLNLAACITILNAYGLPFSEKMKVALCSYRGLPHRCEQIASNDNVMWINDSKATNPGATDAAIKSFASSLHDLYLIGGGDAKGGDISSIVSTIKKNVAHSWVFGKDAKLFVEQLTDSCCTEVADLEVAVKSLKKITKQGDRVLLSPACASIDMYQNYQARGEHFTRLVQELSHE